MERNFLRWSLALVVLLAAGSVLATGPRGVRETAEASMLVTGTVDIEPDGRVSGYRLDRVDELPPAVVDLVTKAAGAWRFEPVLVDGVAAPARTSMSLRLVARQLDEDQYVAEVRSAKFGEVPSGQMPRNGVRTPPRYPGSMLAAGVSGTVYLVARFGIDGTVEDVIAEQVNLKVVAGENQMRIYRRTLAQASIAAARKWTFVPPTDGLAAGETHWSVRVPVSFNIGRDSKPEYGQWQAYVPGPRQEIPWISEDEHGFSPDALAAGGIYPLGQHGPRLLTGPNGS